MDPRVQVEAIVPVRARTTSSMIVRCTVHDRMYQRFAPPVAFFYPGALDEDALIEGLATALERAPIFAGRIQANGEEFQIACDNSGVTWSRATIDLTLEEAIAATSRGQAPWLFELVDVLKARTSRAPLFAVRLSQLKDGATVLGVRWHHSIGDMHSFMLLMRAWSAAVEGTEISDPILVEDREAHLAAHIPEGGSDRPGMRLLGWGEIARLIPYMAWEARRKARLEVQFSDAEIERMRQVLGDASGQRLSANDAICAHIMEVLGEFDDLRKERLISIAVNYRRRVGIDPRLIGNLITGLSISCRPGEEAAGIARRIREGVTRFAEEHMDYHSTMRFVAGRGGPSRLKRCVLVPFDPLNRTLVVTNWSNYGVYDISFCGRSPAYFTPLGNPPTPWISTLVEGPGKTGLLFSGHFPLALATRLNSEEGLARLHRFR